MPDTQMTFMFEVYAQLITEDIEHMKELAEEDEHLKELLYPRLVELQYMATKWCHLTGQIYGAEPEDYEDYEWE